MEDRGLEVETGCSMARDKGEPTWCNGVGVFADVGSAEEEANHRIVVMIKVLMLIKRIFVSWYFTYSDSIMCLMKKDEC